jgi:hypothetical protein
MIYLPLNWTMVNVISGQALQLPGLPYFNTTVSSVVSAGV